MSAPETPRRYYRKLGIPVVAASSVPRSLALSIRPGRPAQVRHLWEISVKTEQDDHGTSQPSIGIIEVLCFGREHDEDNYVKSRGRAIRRLSGFDP